MLEGMPGVRNTLDRMVGPPMVRKMTAPRLANSCHLPKVKALTPNRLPVYDSDSDQHGHCSGASQECSYDCKAACECTRNFSSTISYTTAQA